MLQFNPKFRMSASQLLREEIFDECREMYPKHEVSPSMKINLEYDQKEAFNYDTNTSSTHTMTQLKAMLETEI